jgi:Na+-driven multidrug efflux pump
MVKKCFYSILKYAIYTGAVFSVSTLVLAPLAAKAFLTTPSSRDKFVTALQIYAIHCTMNVAFPVFSSIFRYLEMKTFVFVSNFVAYNGLILAFCCLFKFVFEMELNGPMFSYLCTEFILVAVYFTVFFLKHDEKLKKVIELNKLS